ncbi:MAG: FUSC family protein, partial [Solirubrobacteraceae bacterium]
ESSAGDWHLAGLRVINTLIGGLLALLGARLLWPTDEWNRLPEFSAETIRADAAFLRNAARVAHDANPHALGTLRDDRRAIALSAANAEDSFQRLLSDHAGPSETLEPIMAVLVYSRRVATATATLALAGEPNAAEPEVDRFVTLLEPVLNDLADAVATGRAPAPFPPEPTPAEPRMRRIARQVRLLHDAVDRWMTSDAVPRRR